MCPALGEASRRSTSCAIGVRLASFQVASVVPWLSHCVSLPASVQQHHHQPLNKPPTGFTSGCGQFSDVIAFICPVKGCP
eukprot:1367499-Rhodomonas_salina.1